MLLAISIALACGLPAAAQGNGNNECDAPGEFPDIVVGDLTGTQRWGSVDGTVGYSFGTDSCNLGTCEALWFGGTSEHPVIAQNIFRLRDGRFEQLGQGWLKHGFAALQLDTCSDDCMASTSQSLGINCSDIYWAGLNGNQSGMGMKSEVDPVTGQFPYPPTNGSQTGDAIFKRVQIVNSDLNPDLNPGARYFAEGHYITPDDAAAGRGNNNASWREMQIFGSLGVYDLVFVGETQREKTALEAWSSSDPGVALAIVDIPGDGRFLAASAVTSLPNGYWHYEYAVQNLNSERAARAFSLPLAPGIDVQAVGFRDVEYHSGEPWDGTDWSGGPLPPHSPAQIVWGTELFDDNPDANALRWGTVYNFRFEADRPPELGSATLSLFKPGTPAGVTTTLHVPRICNDDGVCDPGETGGNCASDCANQGGGGGVCGDGTCDPGETPCTCETDCGACVVNCTTHPQCDDGVFCNGAEICAGGVCKAGTPACADEFCGEDVDACLECLVDNHCDDGDPCNGVETCQANVCVAGELPCDAGAEFCNPGATCIAGDCIGGVDPCPGRQCDEVEDVCVDCFVDADCDDTLFCNGVETCVDEVCVPAAEGPCGEVACSEDFDACAECESNEECDDGLYCNGAEQCVPPGICIPSPLIPCVAECDEAREECIGNVFLQPRPGDPLPELDATALQRFDAGGAWFDATLDAASGLGPIYNADGCAACHRSPAGADSGAGVTRFGFDDGLGGFDPLTELGGTLMQSQTIDPACVETVPPEANVTASRRTTTLLGAGLVEALDDSQLEANETTPPNANISGRLHLVPVLEDGGNPGGGRFGWKSQSATLLSAAAEAARDHIGLTNRLVADEAAPNGDQVALAQCDPFADPEDGPDGEGFDYIDRVSDFVRYLAPPPQTPRTGLSGENFFSLAGCTSCHTSGWTTPDDPQLEPGLRAQFFRPFSDFLLHDMGDAGDGIAHGAASMSEVRTAPLWGLRLRGTLWHDGRFDAPTLEQRIRDAIAEHDAPGSEAAWSVTAYDGLPAVGRDGVVTFLASLGRLEFDQDGDNDVDADDYLGFQSCFTGPGNFYNPNHECAVSDVDQDGDVDDDDFDLFLLVADGTSGRVPDGAGEPGAQLSVARSKTGELTLSWAPSCLASDVDYQVYEGALGDFVGHTPVLCTTDGDTEATFTAAPGGTYYLVTPGNGFKEGSYGSDGAGQPRPASAASCLPQSVEACQ
ncbi:MAG: hypothetical protein GY716_22320 [bacterium]|nr:hypothetical protein [bacterium]